MPERKFTYMDEGGVRRTLVWDEASPEWFGVFAEADMTNLARLNQAQGEYERATDPMTVLARIPYTEWERAYHENWDKKDWDKFLNDSEFRDYRVWKGRV